MGTLDECRRGYRLLADFLTQTIQGQPERQKSYCTPHLKRHSGNDWSRFSAQHRLVDGSVRVYCDLCGSIIRKETLMPKVRANNITINYDQQGSGEPLVLIPYLAADHACYAFQVPEYAKQFTCGVD